MIRRRSWNYTGPTQTVLGTWRLTPGGVTTGDVGGFLIEIGAQWDTTVDPPERTAAGTDITYIDSVRSLIRHMAWGEPYGELDAIIDLPRLAVYDAPEWLAEDANIDIWRVLPADEATAYGDHSELGYPAGVMPHWHGFVANDPLADGAGISNAISLHCLGAMYGEIANRVHQPVMRSASRDIGTILGHALFPQDYARPFNRYAFYFETATTGIESRTRGTRGQMVINHVDEIIGLAQDSAGQWTISRAYDLDDTPQARKYYLRLKSPNVAGAIQATTITAGGYGVDLSAVRDLTTTPNAVYGEGTTPLVDGEGGDRWRNAKHPGLSPAQPTYPDHYPLSRTDTAGDADADFTADVITQLQYALRLGAWPYVEITGVFDLATEIALEALQEDAGATVTGTITDDGDWDLVFETSAEVYDIDGGYFRPLSEVTEAAQYLYAANGAVRGANDTGPTAWDGRRRIETIVSHDQARKDQARAWSRRLARQSLDGVPLAGTVTLTSDPEETSRYLLKEGGWQTIIGLDGGTSKDVYLAAIRQQPEAPRQPVQLTIAERAWDLLELQSRLDRDKEASTDPAKSHFSLRRRERRPFRDSVGWDKESGAGIHPKIAHPGGEWIVTKIIGAQVGTVQSTKAWTSPDTEFAIALFAKAITPAALAAIVPDPLAASDYRSPFRDPANEDALDAAGFLEVWGSELEPGGYSPGAKGDTNPLTGRLVDDMSASIVSFDPPYIWAASWCVDAADLWARQRIAIEQ